jgi:cation diffusion facilitator family transporter
MEKTKKQNPQMNQNQIENTNLQEKQFEKEAMKVSTVSIVVNVLLSLFKLLAGVIAHSGAMISDAIHSASDVFSTIIVMVGIHLAGRKSDKEHPYGHERMECVAAIVLATVLAVTGLGIGWSAIQSIAKESTGVVVVPGVLALVAAVVSILTKEGMYWYTRFHAKKIDSSALMADAWHHRSDALSSVGALVGIAASRMGYPLMDPLASLVICFFIEKAALDIFKDAIDKMVDKACDEQTEQAIRECASKQEGVVRVDMLKTRVFGNKIYVDIEIGADGNETLREAHAVAEEVHNRIENEFPKVKHIMVHVNPA